MHKTLPTHDPRREHKPNSPYQPPNGTRGNDKARKRSERKKKSTPIPTFRAEKKEEKMSFFAPKKKKKLRFAVNPFHADHQRNMYRCDFYIVPVAATALLASLALSERLMSSCARQRLVAASSRRTEENVASRSGSGRHCRRASRARLLSLSLVPLVN